MDQLSLHLRRKFVIADKGTISTSPTPRLDSKVLVQYLQEDLVVDSINAKETKTGDMSRVCRKDDSADVTRVYHLDNLVVHSDDSSLRQVT